MDNIMVKVRSDNGGPERIFYGVIATARPHQNAVFDHGEVTTDVIVRCMKAMSLPNFMSKPYSIVLRSSTNIKDARYFAVQRSDGEWVVVIHDGKVYVCNRDGTTIDSFR